MTQPSNKTNPRSDKDNDSKNARSETSSAAQTRAGLASDIQELSDKYPGTTGKEPKTPVGSITEPVIVAPPTTAPRDVVIGKSVEVKASPPEPSIKSEPATKAKEVASTIEKTSQEVKEVVGEKLTEAKEMVVDTMQEASEQARRSGSALWEFTRANATPLALLGVGAGWLIMSMRRPPMRERAPIYRATYGDRTIATDDGVGRGASMRRPTTTSAISERTHEAVERANGALQTAKHAISDRTTRSARYVTEQVRRAGTASTEFASSSPFVVATTALAAGVGIGMLLPSTQREDELLRPARQKFQEMIGEVRDVATDVAQAAKDTAKETVDAVT